MQPLTCPTCGSRNLLWSYTCHTWSDSTGAWKSCLPCDSAVEYWCNEDECDWGYTQGLNPGNPRSPLNEAHRPPWALQGDQPNRAVRAVWDQGETE